MPIATLNGAMVHRAQVSVPEVGAWHADVELTEPLTGADELGPGGARLVLDGVTFVGTVVRGGIVSGAWRGKLVGGRGALAGVLPARAYVGTTVRGVLADLMRESGEVLSSGSDAAALAKSLSRWERARGAASRGILALAAEAGVSWRVLRDGSVFIGAPSWADVDDPGLVLDEDWVAGTVELAPGDDGPTLEPGVMLRGMRVAYVVHRLESGRLRTEAHARAPGGLFDRLLDAARAEALYARTYPARVVGQNADGTLSLAPDDAEVSGASAASPVPTGLDKVPIRYGLPGVTARVPAGTRVRVGFDAGDPSRPFAAIWDAGSVTELTLAGGTQPVARQGDLVLCGGPLTTVTFGPPGPSPMVAGAPYTMLFNVVTSPPGTPYLAGSISSGNPKVKA